MINILVVATAYFLIVLISGIENPNYRPASAAVYLIICGVSCYAAKLRWKTGLTFNPMLLLLYGSVNLIAAWFNMAMSSPEGYYALNGIYRHSFINLHLIIESIELLLLVGGAYGVIIGIINSNVSLRISNLQILKKTRERG